MQTGQSESETPPPQAYRFEPAWWVHGVALAALALSAAPLWALQFWAPALAFTIPPLVGVGVIWACRRAALAGQAAFIQARLAETIGAIPDPTLREAEANAAWARSPRTPAAAGWLFWVYVGLGGANALALAGWVTMALGLFSVTGSGAWAIAAAMAGLYGVGFLWAAIGVIGAAVRVGADHPNTDQTAALLLAAELRADRMRAEAMALEALFLAAAGAGMAVLIAQAIGLTLIDIARAAWPAPGRLELPVLGLAVPAPNLRELEAPLWRAKMAVTALLAAVAAYGVVLVLRTPLVETLARLTGKLAASAALRAAGAHGAARDQEGAALRRASELTPLRFILAIARAFGLAALLIGLTLGLGLLAPGLAAMAGSVIAAAVGLMALERMRQALLAGQLDR